MPRHLTNFSYRKSREVARAAAALEKIFNIQLFESDRRGIILTKAGEAVRLRAVAIEAELRNVINDAIRCGDANGGFTDNIEVVFDERYLRLIAMLTDTHDVSIVARAMGMSYSAACRMLAKLEDVVGQPLFHPAAHGMLASDVAICWVVRFKRVLKELCHIESDIVALKCVSRA